MKRVVFLAFIFSIMPGFAFAANATLFVSPERGAYGVGETFEVRIMVDSGGADINAAEADLTFDPQAITVDHISTEGSILTSWSTDPQFSNEQGIVRFSGWTQHAFNGGNGLLITIVFKGERNMTSNAYLASGAVLSMGGDDANIVTAMRSAAYSITDRKAAMESRPDKLEQVETHALLGDGEDLIAPIFTDYPSSLALGERIIIKGKTNPNSKVLIWTERGDGTKTDSSLMSAADGTFTYVSDQGVEMDIYRVQAEVFDGESVRSKTSKKVAVMVHESSNFAAAASAGAAFIYTVLPLLLIVVVAGLAIGYLMYMREMERLRKESTRITHFQ